MPRKTGGAKQGGNRNNGERQDYPETKKENERFESYYNQLQLVPEGQETDEFWAAMRRELPNSFRFCGSKGHALLVQHKMTEKFIPEITNLTFDDAPVQPPEPISWYPSQLAWQMTTSKRVVRRFPPFASFQRFLVLETAVGSISRQEAVSMIPPLLLDVKPGHTVLDLCAAPGSKSAQLVELLHTGEEDRIREVLSRKDQQKTDPDPALPESYGDQGRSTGFLVANDMNYSRAQMLVHQLKRLNSPNLIVTNHDATMFPSIELQPSVENGKTRGKWLKFDRILADVPCSGDGTCRKNPNVWKDWTPSNALGLYMTQVRILVRSLQMLKVGGRVVYSTCSLNPMENEAVIASAIDRCGGPDKVELVNVSAELPELKRSPGLRDWKVMDKEGRFWNNYSEVEDAMARKYEASLQRLVPGMFSAMAKGLAIENCVRVYPHQQDTGGFFITVLVKKSEIKAKPESEAKKTNNEPSVMSLVEQIESAPVDSTAPVPVLPTLTELDGKQTDHDDLMNRGNTSAAARQNKAEVPDVDADADAKLFSKKRSYEEAVEAGASHTAAIKRAKTEKDELELGKISENGQMEHFPPHPANQLTAAADEARLQHDGMASGEGSGGKRKRQQQAQEESFKFLSPDHPELQRIFDFYGLSPEFPRDRFLVRNAMGEPVKAIYYTTALGKDILTTNEGKGIKFVHSGVKMFVKQDAQGANICQWRVQNEGLSIVEGWLNSGRVIKLHRRSTLRYLLKEMFPKVAGNGWEMLGEIGQRIRDLSMGCCVLEVEPNKDEDGFEERMVLPLWKGLASVNLMVPKDERKALLYRLFDDIEPLIDHSQRNAPTKTEGAGVAITESNGTAIKEEQAAEDEGFASIESNGTAIKEEQAAEG